MRRRVAGRGLPQATARKGKAWAAAAEHMAQKQYLLYPGTEYLYLRTFNVRWIPDIPDLPTNSVSLISLFMPNIDVRQSLPNLRGPVPHAGPDLYQYTNGGPWSHQRHGPDARSRPRCGGSHMVDAWCSQSRPSPARHRIRRATLSRGDTRSRRRAGRPLGLKPAHGCPYALARSPRSSTTSCTQGSTLVRPALALQPDVVRVPGSVSAPARSLQPWSTGSNRRLRPRPKTHRIGVVPVPHYAFIEGKA